MKKVHPLGGGPGLHAGQGHNPSLSTRLRYAAVGFVFGAVLGGFLMIRPGSSHWTVLAAMGGSALGFGVASGLWGDAAWRWLSRQRWWMDWLP